VFSRHRAEPIRPVNFYDEHEDEDEEEYTMNGHEHVNYVNNFNPSTALASSVMNGDADQHAIPTGLVNGEEETLRLLEHGIVEGFVYQQHSSINNALAENGQMARGERPEQVLDTAQFAHLPPGTEIAPGWMWTENGLKRKRGRPRKGSAVFIDAEQLAKKRRKKRKKDELNGITPTQHRIIGYDGLQFTGIVQGPPRNAEKRPVHPAPVTVVQLHQTEHQMMDVANDDQLQGEKGPEWEVLGHGEIGTMVEQIAQALEETGDAEERSGNNGKEPTSAQEYTQYGNDLSYSDLVDTLGVDNRPQPNIEPAQSNTNLTVHKPIESVIASTLEQELQNNNVSTNTVMDISLDEPQSTQPSTLITQQSNNNNNANELSSPENILREIQAVLSPLPNTTTPSTPLPHTPLPNTPLPHTPMPVTPLPNVATPTDPQQPPRPQIDYIHPAPASTPSHQQPLEDGEIVGTLPPSFQTPRTPTPRTPQPRTPQPRTPRSPPPQPAESSQERVSQTLVLEDEGEELLLPSALNGSSDSNGSNSEPQRDSQSRRAGVNSLPNDADRNREIESSNHLTSPLSDDTPRTPLNVLLARTGVYDNDSDIEIEEEPIAVRRKRRVEKRRERSPSPPLARKRQRTNSNSTQTNTNASNGAPGNNNNNNVATNTNAVEQPLGQLDMTAEPPRRRGRQRKDKNVNRFESVDGLIDLVDD
jgi:hypothetical protein